MRFAIEMAERGLLPDGIIRRGIRGLNMKKLRLEDAGDMEEQRQALERLIKKMRNSPVALHVHKPKEQHY